MSYISGLVFFLHLVLKMVMLDAEGYMYGNYDFIVRGPRCMDTISYCSQYVSYCHTHKQSLQGRCDKTCRYCGPQICDDRRPDCAKLRYYCPSLRSVCSRTCGFCGSNGLLTNRIQECEDMREDCSMIIGYCMSHRKRMEQVCRKTCGYCRMAVPMRGPKMFTVEGGGISQPYHTQVECHDISTNCPKLKRFCHYQIRNMRRICPKTCGYCGSTPAPHVDACVDQRTDCATLTKYCVPYARSMKRSCKRTCAYCEKKEERNGISTCVAGTWGGNSEGACCVFPFTYRGQTYNKCTKVNHVRPWCATTDDYNRDKRWGNCVAPKKKAKKPKRRRTVIKRRPVVTRITRASLCRDKRSDCNLLSRYCHTYKASMRRSCAKTCGYCDGCLDAFSHHRCAMLKEYGSCQGNVRQFCRKTCGVCLSQSPTTTTTVTTTASGGCSASKFGCCDDNITPKTSVGGSNCPSCMNKFEDVCAVLKNMCATFSYARRVCRKSCDTCYPKG